jgi:DNA invertase Pin-like site-specific DNA recombinase
MSAHRFVSYLRVSTTRQGNSGLGLEAQRSSVNGYLSGIKGQLITEFVEIESGKNNDRPELHRALAACRIHGATLIVARLDRLARNAHFLLGLKEGGVEFICVDMPSANTLTIGIMAMVAQEEARLISARTKAALKAAKERGVRLGSPKPITNEARRVGSQCSSTIRRAQAARWKSDILPIAQAAFTTHQSYRSTARVLNAEGVPARRGGMWSTNQVRRLLQGS